MGRKLSFFEKRDFQGRGLSTWVLVIMAFLAPFAWWSVRQVDLENDVEHWLPADDPQSRTLQWYHRHFPEDDRILLTWDGSTTDDPRFARLAQLLTGTTDEQGVRREGSLYVDSVLTHDDLLQRMERRGVTREEGLERLAGVLIGRGPLYVRCTSAGRKSLEATTQAILAIASQAAGTTVRCLEPVTVPRPVDAGDSLQAVEAADAAEVVHADATTDDLAEATAPEFTFPPHDLRLLWAGMHAHPEQVKAVRAALIGLTFVPATAETDPVGSSPAAGNGVRLVQETFVQPGSPVAMTVTLTPAGDLETQQALQEIREFAVQAGIPARAMSFGGRPIVAEELNSKVKQVAWNRSAAIWNIPQRSALLLSAVVGAVLACFMLRSIRLAGVVLIAAVYTTLLAVAVVPLSDGNMNMVLVVMPALLLVLTISAAIHVANYWKHAAARNPRTAVAASYRMALQPCLLASLTTALGLLSLTTSPLNPVREFGLYAAIGCVILLLVVLYGVPAMLAHVAVRTSAVSATAIDSSFWQRLATWLIAQRRVVTGVSVAAFALAAVGLMHFRTETKVIRYLPPESQVVADYHLLEDQLAGVVPVEIMIGFDEQACGKQNFLERLEVVRAVQQRLQQHPEISGTLSLADFQPVSRPPASGASVFARASYNRRAYETEQRLRESIDEGAGSLYSIARDDAVMAHAGGRMTCHQGDELWRVTAQTAIMSDVDYGPLTDELSAIVAAELKSHTGTGHCVTGMVPLFLRTQQAVLESLIQSFALAFGMIALVMIAVLRSPLAGVITMLPNVLPVGMVFGIISWLGIPVDLGTMITASVGLGIAVDGTLHLLTWFRAGLIGGCSRHEAIRRALAHCGPAMWQTSAAVGLGLLMLAPAELLLVSRFGWLMASLIGAALLADLILLPALLGGPLGRLIENSVRRTRAAEAARGDQSREQVPGTMVPQPHLAMSSARGRRRTAATVESSGV